MNTKTKIEWTEATWNPVTGCTKISPGCKHCYAESMSVRLQAMGTAGYENGFSVRLHPHRLQGPLSRFTPTAYFVNSMSDLFHDAVEDRYIDRVIEVIERSPQHTFQVLTKRAARMAEYFNDRHSPENLWIGVSVEDRAYGLPRVASLAAMTKATVRFLSVEPLLEDLGVISLTNIDWVIVGGESGRRARPMKTAWVESILQQCRNANVPFFFKQWGAWGPDGVRRSKKANGRLFQNREWNEYPKVTASLRGPLGITG